MHEIIQLLPILGIAVTMNTATGMYYSIGTQKKNFDPEVLFAGIEKACIVAGTFLGAALCFDATDLSSIGITPAFIMTSAIVLYVTKALKSLAHILGIEFTQK